MATGGAARASVKGSDEFHLFMCNPCSKKEIDVGAEVYCLQCQEYLCGKCHSSHDSFSMMAGHTMLDRAQMEAKGPQRPPPLPTVQPRLTIPCDIHPDEKYNLFCEKHNQVCCAACSRIYHKSCDVRYILDVAKKATHGSELNKFRRAVKEIQTNLEKAKKQRELDMQRMMAEKDTEVKKIHTSIKQMIKELEAVENSAINEVTRKFNEFKTKIGNDLTKLGTVINSLNIKLDKLEKANDDAEKFVHVKMCEEDKSSARNLIKDVETRVGSEKIEFIIDERVEETVRKLQSLGYLVYRYSVTPEGQRSVKPLKENNVCTITDICLAEDGSLLMTDANNSCLKRLDQNYNVIERLKFSDFPQGMCSVSANTIAVCLRNAKIVQMVTLHPAMSSSRSFKTTDACCAIAHYADHLYVTCGGWIEKGEGPGHIGVHTVSGTLIRKLQTDSHGRLFSSIAMGVAVRNTDGVIFACDKYIGLVAIRQDGQRLWSLTLKDLEVNTVNMLTVDSSGHLLVTSKRSNKVIVVRGDGRKVDVVLKARDGMNKPRSLCLDERRSRLIVVMKENNNFCAFKIA